MGLLSACLINNEGSTKKDKARWPIYGNKEINSIDPTPCNHVNVNGSSEAAEGETGRRHHRIQLEAAYHPGRLNVLHSYAAASYLLRAPAPN